jgi:DNA invertase Pin-like site-specific DNA recombinase
MRVAIYCRVSTIDQTPENQKIELERYAKAMGWDYIIFEETESTRLSRPIKNKIFQEACRKEWDLIFVWKLDRWARSMQELVNDFVILRNNKVGFRTLIENIAIDDSPTNQLMVNIFCSFADFERAVIRERTMAGLARARAQGKHLGYPKGRPRTKENYVKKELAALEQKSASLDRKRERIENKIKDLKIESPSLLGEDITHTEAAK